MYPYSLLKYLLKCMLMYTFAYLSISTCVFTCIFTAKYFISGQIHFLPFVDFWNTLGLSKQNENNINPNKELVADEGEGLDQPGVQSTLFVKNLNFATKEEDLAALFARVGPIRFLPE